MVVMTSPHDGLSEEALARLKQAAEEAAFLVSRGYRAAEVAAFIGQHRTLSAAEQTLLDSSARLDAHVKHHIARELDPEDVEGRPLRIDAATTLATIAAGLGGAPLIESAAGVLCDPSFCRAAPEVRNLEASLGRAGDALRALRPATTTWLVEDGAGAGARIAAALEEAVPRWRFKSQVKVVPSCAAVLARAAYVVSSDPTILDQCGTWFNLPARVLVDGSSGRRLRLHVG
jgi:hypothetical protein